MSKHVIIAVTNDLVTDQRVNRVAQTLSESGYSITLVGRYLPHSSPINTKHKVKRFKLWFNKGAIFYANYNLRLFFYLLFKSYDIVLANDLDTLLGGWLAVKIRNKKLVYDSHEYFTEVPELIGRNFQKNAWLRLERFVVPKLKYCYTVCDSIARGYNELYKSNFITIRNLPFKKSKFDKEKSLADKVIIYQGALNVGRGIELMIDAMQYLDNVQLWIVGGGDIEQELREQVKNKQLFEKVMFKGRIPLNELHEITSQANLGLSLEEDRGLNYRYALPNKIFDYVQAGIPILVSDLPEMRKVVKDYSIGEILNERTEKGLAESITEMLSNSQKLVNWSRNLAIAKEELIWEKESKKLIQLFEQVK